MEMERARRMETVRSHPSPMRPLKRLRSSPPATDDGGRPLALFGAGANVETPPAPALLPEIWAQVMDFLPYHSVLQSAAVSRSMLHEAMPLVTTLHLDRSRQLHASVVSRYREVKDIYIYSLIRFEAVPDDDDDPHWGERSLDEETALRAVPFLCHFPRLERVFLGGRHPSTGEVEGFNPPQHSLDEDRTRMTELIRAFSGAFRAGALGPELWVLGLRCPRSHRHANLHGESSCLACRGACRSFPLGTVADFECEGSSQRHARARRWRPDRPDYATEQIYGLDVCLARETIESIVRGRPGGRALLASEARLLDLLGRGTRNVVVPDEGDELYVVKYDGLELDAIRRSLRDSGTDARKLAPAAVTDAIRRSFAADVRDPLPPAERCYLAGGSFYELRRLGLPIDEASFLRTDEWDGERCAGVRPTKEYSYNWRFM